MARISADILYPVIIHYVVTSNTESEPGAAVVAMVVLKVVVGVVVTVVVFVGIVVRIVVVAVGVGS